MVTMSAVNRQYLSLFHRIPPRKCTCYSGPEPFAAHAGDCPRGRDLDDLFAQAAAHQEKLFQWEQEGADDDSSASN